MKVTVYVIIAAYQGIVDGVVAHDLEYERACDKLMRLRAKALGLDPEQMTEEEIDDEYDMAVCNDAKIEEYTLEEFELEV